MAYEYDLFISYRRSDAVTPWVQNHLFPRLNIWLNEFLPREARIACDFKMKEGVEWPLELQNQMRKSRLLLAVWSAPYFRSDWCMAEWQSFRDREAAYSFRSAEKPQGLIYPIRYADGDHFHDDAKRTNCKRDFSLLNYPDECFRNTPKYLDFNDAVREMAEEIVDHLAIVPEWAEDFPVVQAPTMPPPVMSRISL